MVQQLPHLCWNVIPKEDFQIRSQNLFTSVANTLKNTLGPYGSTSIIETHNDYKVTKDGWNVLKSLHFNNPVEENILMLLVNIAQRVVRKVGDGSTSSVVAANYLLQTLTEASNNMNIRSKELLKTLEKVTALLEEEILHNTRRIDVNGDFQEIYDLAHVSTNGDDEIANLLKEAYQATRSTSVHFTKSRSYKNELEIIDGYQSKIGYLDPTFVNTDNDTGDYTNIDVIMFDHILEREYHFDFLLEAINKAREKQIGILLIAPNFDSAMHETFAAICNQERSQTGKHHFLVGRAVMTNNHDANMFKDLSALVGAKIVTENVVNEFNKKRIPREEREKGFNTRLAGEANEYIDTNPLNYVGHVGRISLGKRSTLFQDFTHRNENEFELCLQDAKAKLKAQQELDEETAIINQDGHHLEERLIKLNCKTALIKAGGRTTLEKGANYDLLEDAVKACASAFKDGYTYGGNLSISVACTNVLDKHAKGDITLSDTETVIIKSIFEAFKNVFNDVLSNANLVDGEFDYTYEALVEKAMDGNGCFNIVTAEYDNKVINPSMTDIEILKGAISIVSLMVSSNQYISITPNINL